jgi:hypothetical protein
MVKVLAMAALAATWVGSDTEPPQGQLTFSATIVPVVSVEWEEYWRGNQGIAAGHCQDQDRRVAFVVPLVRGQVVVLSPDMPSGVRDGVQYAGLEDYTTETVVFAEK